jgi:succinylarginine dihydrolase
LGFSGKDADVLRKAHREAPDLLAAMASASAMWTANAATVSPSADTADRRVHFTPANLATHLHRAIEPDTTARVLKGIFGDEKYFAHHDALPATPQMGDEGAANHTRLCCDYSKPGLELFVYGAGAEDGPRPAKHPARQTLGASQAVARLHGLDPARCYFAQQNPAIIDQGAFHNDVVAVGNRELLLYHQQAYLDTPALRDWLRRGLEAMGSLREPHLLEIADSEVPAADAVDSYLFNSQLVCPPDGAMWLIAARECEEHPRVWAAIQRLVADSANPIAGVKLFDLRQSMRNGGGPACLRLRVVLTPEERQAVNPAVWLDEVLHARLSAWVHKHYRDRLVLADLADPALLDESRSALDALTGILGLGSLYDFQR